MMANRSETEETGSSALAMTEGWRKISTWRDDRKSVWEKQAWRQPIWSFLPGEGGERWRAEVDEPWAFGADDDEVLGDDSLRVLTGEGSLVGAMLAESARLPLLCEEQEIQLALLIMRGKIAARKLGVELVAAGEGSDVAQQVDLDNEVFEVSDWMRLSSEARDNQGKVRVVDETGEREVVFDTRYAEEKLERELPWLDEPVEENGKENSAEYVAKLWETVELGRRARWHLIRANMRWVTRVAKQFKGQGLSYPALIQAGEIGLMKGVDKYDFTRGFRILSYATIWIRQGIDRYIAKQGFVTIRLSQQQYELRIRIKRSVEQLWQELGRKPSVVEIVVWMGKDLLGRYADEIRQNLETGYDLSPGGEAQLSRAIKRVKKIMWATRDPIYLNKPIESEDGGGVDEYGDIIADTMAESVERRVERDDFMGKLAKAVALLPERKRQILSYRFGFYDGKCWTLNQIGMEFGITGERIGQLEKKSLETLREVVGEYELREFLDWFEEE